MTPQERIQIGQIRREMDRLKSEVVSMRRRGQVDQNSNPAMLPDRYTGTQMASIVGKEVAIPTIHQQRIVVPITISGEGPFVARGIHFAYKYYSQEGYDRGNYWHWDPVYYYDFRWEYRVNNSYRDRQNMPTPQPVVWSAENGYGFMPLIPQDVFPRGATVEISLNPEYGWGNTDDRIWAGFSGYYVLEH
jgi:hypothetical protein